MNLIKKLNLPNQGIKFLLLLLSGDFFYILMQIASKVARYLNIGGVIRDEAFSISRDLGLAESYQYTKEFWIFILFIWLIYKKRNFAYAGWATLYLYLLFDDMLSIHERLSRFTFEKFGIYSDQILFLKVRYQDFGEIGITLLVGILFISSIMILYFRGDGDLRVTFRYLVGWLLLLVFFGSIIDFINRFFLLEDQNIPLLIASLLEDGGEMIAMSLMCWYLYAITEPVQANIQA